MRIFFLIFLLAYVGGNVYIFIRNITDAFRLPCWL